MIFLTFTVERAKYFSIVWVFVSLVAAIWAENAFLTGNKNILDTECATVSIQMVVMILSPKRLRLSFDESLNQIHRKLQLDEKQPCHWWLASTNQMRQ